MVPVPWLYLHVIAVSIIMDIVYTFSLIVYLHDDLLIDNIYNNYDIIQGGKINTFHSMNLIISSLYTQNADNKELRISWPNITRG